MVKYSTKLVDLDKSGLFDGIDEMNFKKFIEEHVDPHLWNFIFKLTLSDRESSMFHKTSKFDWDVPFLDSLGHSNHYEMKRMMHRLYILCVVMFTFNRESKYPLHMIVADVVDKLSNSSDECLQLLNDLGACVSERTLARFQVKVAEKILKEGPSLNENSITCASVDNINSRECYRRVRSTDDHRGFDGTSI